MRINIKTLVSAVFVVIVVLVASCKAPKDFTYFQDANPNTTFKIPEKEYFHIQPEDRLSISVSSKDAELSNLFALKVNTSGGSIANGNNYGSYSVDKDGNIEFPVLGILHVAGMTRQEVANSIKKQLIEQKLVLDPIVTVEYYNLSIVMLGEVGSAGRHNLSRDHCTIIDAIAESGDLPPTALRDSIMVLRNENGTLHTYVMNINYMQNLISSPAYYLQQNDIVYVVPSDMKKRSSSIYGSSPMSPFFWLTTTTSVISAATLIYSVTKK